MTCKLCVKLVEQNRGGRNEEIVEEWPYREGRQAFFGLCFGLPHCLEDPRNYAIINPCWLEQSCGCSYQAVCKRVHAKCSRQQHTIRLCVNTVIFIRVGNPAAVLQRGRDLCVQTRMQNLAVKI